MKMYTIQIVTVYIYNIIDCLGITIRLGKIFQDLLVIVRRRASLVPHVDETTPHHVLNDC